MYLPSMLSQCLSCRNIPCPGWLCSPCLAGFYSLSMDGSLHRAFYYTFSSKYRQVAEAAKLCSCLPQVFNSPSFFKGS